MLNIKKLTSVPVPNGLGKYDPETFYFVKQGTAVSFYITDNTGDNLYPVSGGSGGGGGTSSVTYFIAINGSIPSNLATSDVVIETTTGTAAGKVVRVWTKQSNGSLVLINGSRRVTDGVVDNTIGDGVLATTIGGLYIVPAANLVGDFVGHANQLAIPTGSGFIFVDPDVGSTYYVTSGTNMGQYWTWSGTAWALDISYAQAGVRHWVKEQVWSAGDIVVKDGWTFIANGNIAAGANFAVGTYGATWKALSQTTLAAGIYGETVVASDLRVTSTVPAVAATIDLPFSGVWKIDSFIRAMNDQTVPHINGVSYAFYDQAGTKILDSEVKAVHGSTPEGYQSTSSGRCVVTVTEASTITMKAWRVGNSGQPWILSDANGRSKVTFERIADA